MFLWKVLRGAVRTLLDGIAWLTQDNQKIRKIKDHRFQDYIRFRGLGKSGDTR